ncbi:hypothetical protein H6F88_09890 [Oculatella sp. FACHB-28]|nr:hypothetical protein [Oculatella sp. FACHB-28]MBD2056326.1 hypothetical protein [Oculatella sp. FACHB-28]
MQNNIDNRQAWTTEQMVYLLKIWRSPSALEWLSLTPLTTMAEQVKSLSN